MFRFKGLRGLGLVFMLGALGSFHGTAAAESKGVILLAKISGEVKVQVDRPGPQEIQVAFTNDFWDPKNSNPKNFKSTTIRPKAFLPRGVY